MTRPALAATLIFFFLAAAQAQDPAGADSTGTFPAKVPYRSAGENAAALPGKILYTPFAVLVWSGEKASQKIIEERLIERLADWLTTADGRIGVRPLATTSLGGGARIFYKDLIADGDAVLTSTSGRRISERQHHQLQLTWPDGLVGFGPLKAQVDFNRESRERFFGIGNDTGPPTTFRQEKLTAAVEQRHSLTPFWHASGTVAYHSTAIDPGHGRGDLPLQIFYPPGSLAGRAGRHHFAQADLNLEHEHLRITGNRARFSLGYKQGLDAPSLSHFKFGARAQHVAELFYRRTLALALGVDWRWAPGSNQVPFYDLAALGGQEGLRGYRRDRFRDRGAVIAATEYSFPIIPPGFGYLFYETGRVFHTPGDFAFDAWRHSYGGGIRMWGSDSVVFEQMLAISPEGRRLRFSFNTTF